MHTQVSFQGPNTMVQIRVEFPICPLAPFLCYLSMFVTQLTDV